MRVLKDLAVEVPALGGKTFEIHTGKLYFKFGLESGLQRLGAVVRRPLAHVADLGWQYGWYR